jgi:hypothetical protein
MGREICITTLDRERRGRNQVHFPARGTINFPSSASCAIVTHIAAERAASIGTSKHLAIGRIDIYRFHKKLIMQCLKLHAKHLLHPVILLSLTHWCTASRRHSAQPEMHEKSGSGMVFLLRSFQS